MENKLDINNKIVTKCLKSYLTGKKYFNTDIDKSYDYFKQCIIIMNDIRSRNIKLEDELSLLMDETETECSKFLTLTIESTIDRPILPCVKIEADVDKNNLFEMIETGCIDKLKSKHYGTIDFAVYNESGLTPLHYAIKYGDTTFLKLAFKLGANVDQTNKFGHTLLEYACLEKDPNLINFLMSYGADMKKHLLFREGRKYFNKSTSIDTALLEKIVLETQKNTNKVKYLEFVFNYIDPVSHIDIDYCDQETTLKSAATISFSKLIENIDSILQDLPEESANTYCMILREELESNLQVKLGCPNNKIDLILYNLVPFINYGENIKYNWLISLEVKYVILKILRNKARINTIELKKELKELLYNSYIRENIVPEGLIQTVVLQWINKIKV